MRQWCRVAAVVAFGVGAVAGGVGCGATTSADAGDARGAKVTGVLLHNGKPVKPLAGETITVSFVRGDGDSQVASGGEVSPEDGSFAIDGPTGQGLPPGEYRVGVAGDVEGGGDGANRFEERFNSEVTPLTADVGAGDGQRFEIDLARRTVTRK